MTEASPRRAAPRHGGPTPAAPSHAASPGPASSTPSQARHGARQQAVDYAFSDPPSPHHKRVYRRRFLRTSILLTLLSTLVPGLGLLGARSRTLKLFGGALALAALGGGGYFAYWALKNQAEALKLVSDPGFLTLATPTLVAIGLGWVAVILITHLATRPPKMRAGRRLIGSLVVVALAFTAAAPTAVAARYTRDAYLLITNILPDDVIATSRPTLSDVDPWADKPRLNILLLGADGAASREQEVQQFGVRTDTIIVASIDTATGNLTMVQIPRNVQYTPFPRGSEMAKAFPNGFRGEGDPGEWYINSILPKVELDYPDLMKGNTYRGAEALKLGVEGITGLKIDYFMMLNIDGLQQLIDAMGGVSVNINQRLPIGGSSSNRVADGWLEPGPNQHLDGYRAMWYARSRWSTDDYDRMRRQSCLINAIVDQADPTTIVTRFEPIAAASADMVATDIPRDDFKAIIDLTMKVKDGSVSRLVFDNGTHGYNYDNPDFPAMRQAVADAIAPPQEETPPQSESAAPSESASASATESEPATPAAPEPEPAPSASESEAAQENVTDACAYHPEEN